MRNGRAGADQQTERWLKGKARHRRQFNGVDNSVVNFVLTL
jgi:hypothetical protein